MPEVREAPADTTSGAAARWLARGGLVLLLAAITVLVVGGLKSVGVVLLGLLGMALALAGLWEFLSRRGVLRWLGAAVAVIAPVLVLVLYIVHHVLWAVLVAIVLAAAAVWVSRQALLRAAPPRRIIEAETAPPQRPFLVMNPRSGGGKVARFALDTKAQELGAKVALLDGPGQVDVAALARQAVADGADLLGVAGGDGTQALVAGIAAEHDLPFLVLSAGTRNHFAMDLGLDRDHPDAGLDALDDGVELRLDLGLINDRTFVNNASFGAYAEIVQSSAYREEKTATTLEMLPDLLSGRRGPSLRVWVDGELTCENPKALLVSNNAYELGDFAGLGRRSRLDAGVLGLIGVSVDNAAQAIELLRGRRASSLLQMTAHEIVVESDDPEIPVGIDGESIMMSTPVRCTIQPRALRVRVPRTRPGVPTPRPPLDGAALMRQAFTTSRSG